VGPPVKSKPYVPSFITLAASSILPEVDASTWALGSHRCRIKAGVLARNGNRIKNEGDVINSKTRLFRLFKSKIRKGKARIAI